MNGETQPQLSRRRHALERAWRPDGQVVLLGAGDQIPIPGRADLTDPFRADMT